MEHPLWAPVASWPLWRAPEEGVPQLMRWRRRHLRAYGRVAVVMLMAAGVSVMLVLDHRGRRLATMRRTGTLRVTALAHLASDAGLPFADDEPGYVGAQASSPGASFRGRETTSASTSDAATLAGMSGGPELWNIVDVEATCWDGEPPPGEVGEIIEIGLTVLDLTRGARVARHRLLVRPERSRVSAFCTELTGLTQHEVEGGVSFAEACRRLAKEHAGGARPWASWGDYDRHQFTRQCAATGVAYPFGSRHINAKAVFTQVNGLRKRPGMAQALDLAGLPLEGRHHCGADDAWNIAALILTDRMVGHFRGRPARARD